MGFYNYSPGPRPSSYSSSRRSSSSSSRPKSSSGSTTPKESRPDRQQYLKPNPDSTLRGPSPLEQKRAIEAAMRDDWHSRMLATEEADSKIEKTMSPTDYTAAMNAASQRGPKPSPVMKEADIADLHEAAALLVELNEEKLRLEALAVPEPVVDMEKEKEITQQETKEIQNQLRGEALMFANQIRNADIFGEIKKTEKRTKSIWYRIKVMIGWE